MHYGYESDHTRNSRHDLSKSAEKRIVHELALPVDFLEPNREELTLSSTVTLVSQAIGVGETTSAKITALRDSLTLCPSPLADTIPPYYLSSPHPCKVLSARVRSKTPALPERFLAFLCRLTYHSKPTTEDRPLHTLPLCFLSLTRSLFESAWLFLEY